MTTSNIISNTLKVHENNKYKHLLLLLILRLALTLSTMFSQNISKLLQMLVLSMYQSSVNFTRSSATLFYFTFYEILITHDSSITLIAPFSTLYILKSYDLLVFATMLIIYNSRIVCMSCCSVRCYYYLCILNFYSNSFEASQINKTFFLIRVSMKNIIVSIYQFDVAFQFKVIEVNMKRVIQKKIVSWKYKVLNNTTLQLFFYLFTCNFLYFQNSACVLRKSKHNLSGSLHAKLNARMKWKRNETSNSSKTILQTKTSCFPK